MKWLEDVENTDSVNVISSVCAYPSVLHYIDTDKELLLDNISSPFFQKHPHHWLHNAGKCS